MRRLHKNFPDQELMLSEDVTVMMAIGLPIKHFESLFCRQTEWVLMLYSKLGSNQSSSLLSGGSIIVLKYSLTASVVKLFRMNRKLARLILVI